MKVFPLYLHLSLCINHFPFLLFSLSADHSLPLSLVCFSLHTHAPLPSPLLLAADHAGSDVVSHHGGHRIQGVQEDPGQAPQDHLREPGRSGPEAARLWLQRGVLAGGQSDCQAHVFIHSETNPNMSAQWHRRFYITSITASLQKNGLNSLQVALIPTEKGSSRHRKWPSRDICALCAYGCVMPVLSNHCMI